MPEKTWKVKIRSFDNTKAYNVQAFTIDGAINRAGSLFKGELGYFPQEECFEVKETVG